MGLLPFWIQRPVPVPWLANDAAFLPLHMVATIKLHYYNSCARNFSLIDSAIRLDYNVKSFSE